MFADVCTTMISLPSSKFVASISVLKLLSDCAAFERVVKFLHLLFVLIYFKIFSAQPSLVILQVQISNSGICPIFGKENFITKLCLCLCLLTTCLGNQRDSEVWLHLAGINLTLDL